MIREAATFTLVLMTFLPLSMERVSVHVEQVAVKEFKSLEDCNKEKRWAKRFWKIKANCLREENVWVAKRP
jgi:hypothetical protein